LLLLSKICKSHGIVPASYVLQQELISVGRVLHHGRFTEVSNGKYLGFTVAIKRFKMNEGDSDRIFKVSPTGNLARHHRSAFTQLLCREVIGWKHLFHRNIFPLLGISISADPQHFLIISKWMPNGNVIQYARTNPEANRLRMVRPLVVCPRLFL